MTNKRIKEISEGVFVEALADEIRVNWNPVGEEATVSFISGAYFRLGENDYLSRIHSDSTVSISMAELHQESFVLGDKTVTGQDVDHFVRMLYDKLYNEQAQ